MASLQTLRNKGGIIVAVIIGLALIAFVLGDMLTSGSTLFGGGNSAGEIDGQDISIVEYSSKINYLTEVQKISTGSETLTEEQSASLQSQAWEQLVRQYAVEPSLEKAGITVSETEMADLVMGNNISPIILQVFSNPQTGYFDLQYLSQFVQSKDQDPSGRMQMFWDYLQEEVAAQALMMKYKTLIDKSVYITSSHADLMASIESNSHSVKFVAQTYASIPDSTINVTDSEAKAFFEKNRAQFNRQVESRTVDYVIFEALPSEADYAAADKYINGLVADFKTSDNIQQFVNLNSQSPFDTRYYKEGELTGPLAAFAFEATGDQIYGPELTADQYTVARVSEVRLLPDSVNISHIVLAASDAARADSLAATLRTANAETWAQAAASHSLDEQSSANAGLIGMVDPQTLGAEFAEQLFTTPKGSITVVKTPNAIHIMKVNDRVGESKKVQLGVIKYAVEPSKDTRNAAFAKASQFDKDATAKGFNEAVAQGALAKQTAAIGSNDRQVRSLPNSRELARWAYNANVGDKTNVLEFGDNFVVASLTTVSAKGIPSFDAVKTAVVNALRKEKKSEMIASKFAGTTSVDELAEKLSLPLYQGSDISFNTFIAPEVGYDPAFAGGVCGVKKGAPIKPIIGLAAVYGAQVVSDSTSVVSPALEKQKLMAEREQSAFVSVYQTLIEKSNIEDRRYKFY